jgi:hypothetical protein
MSDHSNIAPDLNLVLADLWISGIVETTFF